MPAITIDTLKTLAHTLTTDHSLEEFKEEHRLAAVLILIYPGKKGPRIILTRRSEKMTNHAGQIAFPGGTVDSDDPGPVHTALREAREEIALDASGVDILGILDVVLLPSGFAVAPVLAVIEEKPVLTANPDEVEEIFSIPLSLACDLNQYTSDFLMRDGKRRDFYILEYQQYNIWGATAKMLRTLAEFLALSSET